MRQLKHFSANGRTNDCDKEFSSASAYDECPDQNDVFSSSYGSGDGVDGVGPTGGSGGGKIMRISRIRRKRRYHQQQYDLIELETNAMKNSATILKDIPNVNARIRNVLDRVQCEISNLRSKFAISREQFS